MARDLDLLRFGFRRDQVDGLEHLGGGRGGRQEGLGGDLAQLAIALRRGAFVAMGGGLDAQYAKQVEEESPQQEAATTGSDPESPQGHGR